MTKTRILAGFLVVAAGASAITAGVLAGAGGAGEAQQGSDAVGRLERTFNQSWRSFCGSDHCTIATFAPYPVTTPLDRASIDVTMTVTLEYATSPGTQGIVSAGFQEEASSVVEMAPTGGFRLASSPRPTTTTLTWVRRRLPAAGRTYSFRFGVSLRSLIGKRAHEIRGRRVSVVIETWTAGS
jgi:hypothetical protein